VRVLIFVVFGCTAKYTAYLISGRLSEEASSHSKLPAKKCSRQISIKDFLNQNIKQIYQ